jgi:hypothetical protein
VFEGTICHSINERQTFPWLVTALSVAYVLLFLGKSACVVRVSRISRCSVDLAGSFF